MKRKLSLSLALVLIGGFAAFQAHAQRGVGDPLGIAQQAVKPAVVAFSGTVKAIISEPCELTTGPTEIGTHILLETAEGVEQNIHLGPTKSVAHVTDQLVLGQTVSVEVFRTDKLSKGNYIAQSLEIDDEMIVLRNEDLRPMWASDRSLRKGRGGPQWGQGNGKGKGSGRGRGAAKGQGRGQGRGQCRDGDCEQGRGQGRGQCRGGNCGQGRGQNSDQSLNAPCNLGNGQCQEIAFVRGQGGGRGQAQGKGRGQGRGKGQGQGRGRGQGRGQGQGQGQGRGQGRGQGQGQSCEKGHGAQCGQQLGAIIDTLPQGDLSAKEREGLLLMREEEKLAHDVYVTLSEKWELRPLANIPQAEARHMEFVKVLLDRYDLADPLQDQTIGKFPSASMQQLYDQLIAQGEESIEGAIQVGALIEELDIADLRRLIDESDNDDIKVVYQNLLKGSRNHLRAFARQLSRYNTTYSTKYLSQAEFDRIASSNHERGVIISDPNFKF